VVCMSVGLSFPIFVTNVNPRLSFRCRWQTSRPGIQIGVKLDTVVVEQHAALAF